MKIEIPKWLIEYNCLINQGFSQRQACGIIGVARSTVQDTLKRIEEYQFQDDKKKDGIRILFFDLELAPTLAYVWRRWKQNIASNQIEKEGGYILTAAWKWLGDDYVHGEYAEDPVEGLDENVCIKLWDAIEQSDVIVGHSLMNFDYPVLNTRLIQNQLPPLKVVKKIDTLAIAKKNFRFNTNKLDDLGKYLGVGRKIDTGGFELWHKVITGDEEAFHKMMEYNKQDVLLLEQVYLKLRSFDSNPQANAGHYYNDNLMRCPVCGSTDVEESGHAVYTPVSKFAEMICHSCGHRSRKRQNSNDKEKCAAMLITPK